MRIYARNTNARTVDDDDATTFIHTHHRQGSVKSSVKVQNIGLYYNDELVMVAQFCAPRTALKERRYTVELLRLCTKTDYRIVGGASKVISYYRENFSPMDIFTYQHTTGENNDVYAKCGFTLVEQDRNKEYLVAPGKTISTGNRKEVLNMAYAVRWGPDRILNTKLGEVYENGKRKSNRKLFIEDLGWHVEKTSGDKVWAWINPNYTHYVYKITATNSPKYYIGISHVKKPNATAEDCQSHDYLGSGKNQFTNWSDKHRETLQKEILHVVSTRGEALELERKLTGTSYMDDPNCLNAMPGGVNRPPRSFEKLITRQTCSIHGETKFSGSSCCKCNTSSVFTSQECATHGVTAFIGNVCQSCSMSSKTTVSECEVHGFTKHQHGRCSKCSSQKSHSTKECNVHGRVSFHGDACSKCLISQTDTMMECEVHGMTKHRGMSCFKCTMSKTVTEKNCEVHGLAKHRSNQCYLCLNSESILSRECSKHGLTKFRNNKCCKCATSKMTTMQKCTVHGKTKFQWGKCCKCRFVESKERKQASSV